MYLYLLSFKKFQPNSCESIMHQLNRITGEQPIQVLSVCDLFQSKWLSARQIWYRMVGSGESFTHEVPYRSKFPSKASQGKPMGVSVIAFHRSRACEPERLILVKQFRIPLLSYVIEFPAGMDDAGETAEQTAFRELQEETGFKATRILGSADGVQFLNPGFCEDDTKLVVVEVDGNDPDNFNPKQQLDSNELIDVILVPINDLMPTLKRFVSEGIQIHATVYAFAFGYHLSKNMMRF
ncbi:putative nudix hydrolase 2 [Trichinella sp. T9]|uniref:Putative nudix hydrolase 2 n=1 Tax=Trichinella murrelli TaxID=144512 RepID=A0A0V0TTA1_9BILA|nr:putative nudix hydrolase 2 [Trichinella murrelli]KRX55670.1 putative nudix hydrolase 2 [Trichinella sp. T9]KRX55685.1 putative nudix hydrolase 2 [Trichinella sp. T9]